MTTLPAFSVSHGAPTLAIGPGLAGAQLRALGSLLDRPRAIVVVSPHWMTRGVAITASERPETIHDFGGFPRGVVRPEVPCPWLTGAGTADSAAVVIRWRRGPA